MKGTEVIKGLEKEGWKVLRSKGSHYRMGRGKQRVTVVVHGRKDLGIGLVKAIEKQSGVKLLSK